MRLSLICNQRSRLLISVGVAGASCGTFFAGCSACRSAAGTQTEPQGGKELHRRFVMNALGLVGVLLLVAAGCSKKATGTGGLCAEESFPASSQGEAITAVACYRTISECNKARIRAEELGGTATECSPRSELWCQAIGVSDTYGCYIDEYDCLRSFRYLEKNFGVASTGDCLRHTSFPGEPLEGLAPALRADPEDEK